MKPTRSATLFYAGKLLIGSLLCLAVLMPARAQQVLLQTSVATDTIPPRTGPNRPWFGHVYLGYGLAAGSSALPVRYGLSTGELLLGGRLKRRLSASLALNADLRYAYLRYRLDSEAALPDPFLRNPDSDQHLAYHQAQAEVSARFNFDRRRGNIVGRYLDVLAYGGWAFATTYSLDAPAAGGGQLEATYHQPPYLSRWLGGVGLRLGSNTLALVGRYRLSPALRGPEALPEPPRYVLGFELGWF